MSDLATIQKPAWLAQQEPTALAGYGGDDEFGEGIPASGGLPYLSIKGRAFTMVDGDDSRKLTTPDGTAQLMALNVVLVAARPAKSKRYYQGAYNPDGDHQADCRSINGIVPDAEIAIPQSKACLNCPLNAFKSADNGKGKACADYKRIVVALATPEGKLYRDADGNPAVVKMDVPADSMSLLRVYNNDLKANGFKAMYAVTRMAFAEAEYPKIDFEFVSLVDEGTFHDINELRAQQLVLDSVSTVLTAAPAATPATQPAGTPALPPDTTPQQAPQQAPQPVMNPIPAPTVDAVGPVAPEPTQPTIPMDSDDGDDLDDMDIKQLKAEAARLNISVPEGKRSVTYRKMIREYRVLLAQGPNGPAPTEAAPTAAPEQTADLSASDAEEIGGIVGEWV